MRILRPTAWHGQSVVVKRPVYLSKHNTTIYWGYYRHQTSNGSCGQLPTMGHSSALENPNVNETAWCPEGIAERITILCCWRLPWCLGKWATNKKTTTWQTIDFLIQTSQSWDILGESHNFWIPSWLWGIMSFHDIVANFLPSLGQHHGSLSLAPAGVEMWCFAHPEISGDQGSRTTNLPLEFWWINRHSSCLKLESSLLFWKPV